MDWSGARAGTAGPGPWSGPRQTHVYPEENRYGQDGRGKIDVMGHRETLSE